MSISFTLKEIAEKTDSEFEGDGALVIKRVVHPSEYRDSSDLVLVMDPKLWPLLEGKNVVAAVFADNARPDAKVVQSKLYVKRPRLALSVLTNMFEPRADYGAGVHATAVIDPSAQLGKNVIIGAHCVVGANAIFGDNVILQSQVTVEADVQIGEDSLLRAGVRVSRGCVIGARCIIHYNAAIGADGFSFVTPERGAVEAAKSDGAVTATNSQGMLRIASLGPVIIGDDVEIGANTAIDRGTVAATRIGSGTKIDNQVQVGHNVQIGENCTICGRVGIAGSTQIGNRVVIGGGCGIADHIKIGDDAVLMAGSGVGGNIPSRQLVGGFPAVPRDKLVEQMFLLNRLKSLFKKADLMDERLNRLEQGDKNG